MFGPALVRTAFLLSIEFLGHVDLADFAVVRIFAFVTGKKSVNE